MTAAIALAGIGHRFGPHRALSEIDLDIAAGEYVVLLGPSGCGKTTLLSVLGGFVQPAEGAVRLGGQDITRLPPARRPTTTMFQDYALFPHMTLADNVGFGLRMRGMARRARRDRAEALLDMVGLPGMGRSKPHQISGGQRQRVALARALAVEPDVLLLDEPLGALDLKLRRAMQDELKALQRRLGTTFVHVTHDQEEAMAIADRIVVMRDGRIEDQGPPDRIYRQPASLFTAAFMGEITRIPAQRSGAGLETALGPLDRPAPAGADRTVVCLRPETVQVGEGAEGWAMGTARIADQAFFGTHYRVQLVPDAAPDLTLLAHMPPGTAARTGARVTISADPSALSIFAEEPAP